MKAQKNISDDITAPISPEDLEAAEEIMKEYNEVIIPLIDDIHLAVISLPDDGELEELEEVYGHLCGLYHKLNPPCWDKNATQYSEREKYQLNCLKTELEYSLKRHMRWIKSWETLSEYLQRDEQVRYELSQAIEKTKAARMLNSK